MKESDKPKLFIKDGKIVNEKGKVVQPEIGNTEHIELTKKYNSSIENGIQNFWIDARVDVEVKFDCLCGNSISCDKDHIDIDIDNNGVIDVDITSEIRGAKTTCFKCNQKYKIGVDKNGCPTVMMICDQEKQKRTN